MFGLDFGSCVVLTFVLMLVIVFTLLLGLCVAIVFLLMLMLVFLSLLVLVLVCCNYADLCSRLCWCLGVNISADCCAWNLCFVFAFMIRISFVLTLGFGLCVVLIMFRSGTGLVL